MTVKFLLLQWESFQPLLTMLFKGNQLYCLLTLLCIEKKSRQKIFGNVRIHERVIEFK